MSSECLALNNETTRHSSRKKPDEVSNLSFNGTVGPKGVNVYVVLLLGSN